MSIETIRDGAENASVETGLYRAVWRWHFYAGLFSLPFMILLAVTGGLYLFQNELNRILYKPLMVVTAQTTSPLNASDLIARAQMAIDGAAVRYVPATEPTDAVEIGIKGSDKVTRSVYVNPYTGDVLGAIGDKDKVMWIVRKLHSLKYFGTAPERVIEIVGGWAIILVITGFYLWWPRKQTGGVVTIRSTPKKRVFWRDLHAVTGAFAGIFIFFLAFTGMPWSGFWGNNFNNFVNNHGLGYPPEFWDDVPKSTVPMKDALTETNWTLSNQPMPVSENHGTAPIGIDEAIAIFNERGIAKGYTIDLPGGEDGVYSASAFGGTASEERVIHLDQYTGKPLFDGDFASIGVGAKGIEWGISVHMGREFGLINKLVMAAACIAIVLMAVAAIVMWWKRRPKGSLGAPRYPSDVKINRGILLIAAGIGILYPLVGASLIVMLIIDKIMPRSLYARLG